MTTFSDWLNRVCVEAYATPEGQALTSAGFVVFHTGGGCLAWRKPLENGGEILITDDEGFGLPVNGDGTVGIGVYDADGQATAEYPQFASVAEAVAFVSTL